MIKKYPYLNDINFLNKIYSLHNKTLYTNITALDWRERRLEEIQGRTTSCSISINGDSAVRRTINMSVYIKSYDELYNNPDSLFTINKKVFIEIGLKNTIGHLSEYNYPDYPIIWFPFGVYVIQSASINRDSGGVNLSMTLGDKMCLLNGTAGGTIPASTNFESYDTLGPDGSINTESIKINQIIPELVNHFGGEDLNNIIVNDVEDRITQVMKWHGASALYIWEDKNDPQNLFYTTSFHSNDFSSENWAKHKIVYNYDCGYIYTDFVYPGELVASAGDTVCTVLDKIKSTLGNFEYFYDVFGKFHFQEIKNYVNVSEWRTAWKNFTLPNGEADKTYYLPYAYNTRLSTSSYTFDNSLIVNYSNSPQYNMIKNDFIVWGTRKTDSNQQLPCRYHLAIDSRPQFTGDYTNPIPICFDTSVSDGIRRCYAIQSYIQKDYDEASPQNCFPLVGEIGKYYYDMTAQKVYSWIVDVDDYKLKLNNMLNTATNWYVQQSITISLEGIQDDQLQGPCYLEMPLATYYAMGAFTIHAGYTNGAPNTDWRNVLYFADFFKAAQGLDTSYYWAEMYNEWPKLYNIEGNDWIPGVLDSPSSMDWWLDIIDNDSAMNKFSVDNIGRRSYAKTESGCNCVFEPDIPNSVLVDVGIPDTVIDSRNVVTQQELRELGLNPVQVSSAIFSSIVAGGSFNSCYQNVRQLLTDYTNYNENISVTCLPIYHLEPNTRVTFNDPTSGVVGDYIINSISFDVSANGGTMSINAKKVIEKI